MTLLIRRMIPQDLDQVVEIDQASFSLPWPARSFLHELTENPAARCWVAEMDGGIAGMIVMWLILDEVHIATLATKAGFRRQGVADSLLMHALTCARGEGARKAFLEVRAGNRAAQAMYRKHGFIQDGRRPRYYKDNQEDAILMSLERLPEEA